METTNEILEKEMRDVLKTLPIGYYFGKKLSVEIDDKSPQSFITDDLKIKISKKSILKSFKDNFKENEKDDKMEWLIRGSLYHEMNHAILTPMKKLSERALCHRVPFNIVNIVEDARINKTMKGYYLKTDFDWDKRAINNYWEPKPPVCANDLLYKAVIFNEFNVDPKAAKEIKKACDDIFENFANIKCNSKTTSWCDLYMLYISILWNKCLKLFPEDESEGSSSGKGLDSEGTESDSERIETDLEKDGSGSIEIKTGSKEPNKEAKDYPKEPSSVELSEEEREELRSSIENFIEELNEMKYDKKVEEVVKRQLLMKEKRVGTKRGSDYCHNGKFDHHRVPKDHIGKYDWFAKEGKDGTMFDGIKLNLFIDCSGSFKWAEDIINRIISSLEEVERSDKSFIIDVITVGERNTLLDKKNRTVICSAGNIIYPDIWDIYKKVNPTNIMCYNIICFDGDALSMDVHPCSSKERKWKNLGRVELAKNFKVWNHSNCYIISDPSNKVYTDHYINKGHVIITNDYTDELRNQIIRCLKVMIK